MTASKLHWRMLTLVTLIMMAAALTAPRFMRPPDIQENRVLAQRPAWPASYGEFETFRKGVDAWVADKFPARPHLIGGLNRIRMLAGVSGSPKTLVGRDGWLFYDDDTHLGAARGVPPWTEAETRAWLSSLAGRTEFLQARGAPYVVVAAPLKETLYPQFAPDWFGAPNPNRPALSLSRLARASAAGEVLYLHGPIAAATRSGLQTFSRHDTHWNGPGAYVGYAALMRRLQALGATEGPRPLSDFRRIKQVGKNQPRDLALMLGVASLVDVRYPRYHDPAAEAANKITWLTGSQEWTAARVIETGQAGKPVVLITLDSFANELLPLLYGHFSRLIVVHHQHGAWREDLIERFKPDLVILETVESGLGFTMGGGPTASAEAMQRIDKTIAPPAPQVPKAPAAPPVPKAPAAPPVPKAPAAPPVQAAPSIKPMARAAAAETGRFETAKPAPKCNLEAVALTRDPDGAAKLVLEGWLTEPGRPAGSGQGFVRLRGPKGDFLAPMAVDQPRPDVAQYFKGPETLASGYAQIFRIERPAAGTYQVEVYRRSSSSGWLSCKGAKALVLR